MRNQAAVTVEVSMKCVSAATGQEELWYFIVGTRVCQESEARVSLLVPKITRTVTESIKIGG